MKHLLIILVASALFTSCVKENLQPSISTTQTIDYSTSNSSIEDCLEHNKRIIDNIVDSISQHGSWRKSMAFYYHIKTRDSLSDIFNQLISKVRVYESPQVYQDPIYLEDAKFDMLDSMKNVWNIKESIINSETQQAIEDEINKRRQSGDIWKCDEDTYDPTGGNKN